MLVATAFFPGRDARPALAFVAAYAGVCLWNWRRALRRAASGPWARHARSRVARLFPGLDEHGVRGVAEPVLVFAAGTVCSAWCAPLGAYLAVASLALFLSANLRAMWGGAHAMRSDWLLERATAARTERNRPHLSMKGMNHERQE